MLATQRNPALETAAADIVKKLGGIWRDEGAMCRCPAHDDRSPSLSVRVGSSSLLFKCFAGCDTIDVLRAIRRLKLPVPVDTSGSAAPCGGSLDARMAGRARDIWDAAGPIAGTPAEGYLAGRGIHISSNALRYHPRTPIGRGRAARFRPAMIAAVRERNRVVAVKRFFLDVRNACIASDLVDPKLTLGRPLAGAVMLQPAGRVLGLAEGVETALSAAILLGFPVWATLGNERLHQVALPEIVRTLILLPDNDKGGRLGEHRAREAHARGGLQIETTWPWGGLNDWNDVLMSKEGEGASARWREMA
jgi:putative DNA primase/helicase